MTAPFARPIRLRAAALAVTVAVLTAACGDRGHVDPAPEVDQPRPEPATAPTRPPIPLADGAPV
ncbi:MAG: hypothetical protein AAFX50_07380, partial [Acidobacteriota bacterium]